jgi:uncharacterized protein YqgC (DUF456 family)
MDPIVFKVAAALLVIVGIAGTVLPVLPGVPMVFAGLAILGVLTALAVAADFVASAFGAKRMGASPRAIVGATLGAIVGIFFGLPGLVLGPFVGAVAGELSANRALLHAGRAGLGTWLGLLLGSVAKLSLAFLMLGVFATAYLLSG